MLEALDRCRRDSTLFQFIGKRLRDFIDPNHLLIQIDEQLDFTKLVASLGTALLPRLWPASRSSRDNGAGSAHLLALQHRRLPQIVFGHLRGHCISLVLVPHHRRPGVRPFHHCQ